jgi:hypothetical protein
MKTTLHILLVVLALFAGVNSALAQLTNLGIAPAGNQTVLFWPTTLPDYILQSTTNLASPNWVTVSNSVPVNAIEVTNVSPASFFRLIRNTTSDGMAFIPAGSFTIGDNFGWRERCHPHECLCVGVLHGHEPGEFETMAGGLQLRDEPRLQL